MSDSKWKKLVDGVVKNHGAFRYIEFKKISDARTGVLYIDENTTYDFDYWQTGFEGCNSLGGWLLYREIEYVNFPAEFVDKNAVKTQDLDQVKQLLDATGKFELVVDRENIKLVCYSK